MSDLTDELMGDAPVEDILEEVLEQEEQNEQGEREAEVIEEEERNEPEIAPVQIQVREEEELVPITEETPLVEDHAQSELAAVDYFDKLPQPEVQKELKYHPECDGTQLSFDVNELELQCSNFPAKQSVVQQKFSTPKYYNFRQSCVKCPLQSNKHYQVAAQLRRNKLPVLVPLFVKQNQKQAFIKFWKLEKSCLLELLFYLGHIPLQRGPSDLVMRFAIPAEAVQISINYQKDFRVRCFVGGQLVVLQEGPGFEDEGLDVELSDWTVVVQ